MKNILSLFLIGFFFCFAKCNKEDLDFSTLPPATQEGRNTLGFMLNGKAWAPKGFRVTGNLSIDYDPGYNQGIFNIVAYDFSTPISQQFTIGIRDSLNFINAPISFHLNQSSLYVVSFSKSCNYFSTLQGIGSNGNLTITKLDRANHIISGTFSATLYKTGCDTIKITEGRFDMKF